MQVYLTLMTVVIWRGVCEDVTSPNKAVEKEKNRARDRPRRSMPTDGRDFGFACSAVSVSSF